MVKIIMSVVKFDGDRDSFWGTHEVERGHLVTTTLEMKA